MNWGDTVDNSDRHIKPHGHSAGVVFVFLVRWLKRKMYSQIVVAMVALLGLGVCVDGVDKCAAIQSKKADELPQLRNEIDLNGDGVNEILSVRNEDDGKLPRLFLYLNEIKVSELEKSPYGYYKIVDIDSNDGVKELAVTGCDVIDSSYSAHFYFYTGKCLIGLGAVEGVLGEDVVVDGSGVVLANERLKMLEGNEFVIKLRKDNNNNTLVKVPEKFHKLKYETDVTVLKKLMLQKSPNDTSVIYTLMPNQEVSLVYGNENGWFAVKDNIGRIGWFKVHEYDIIDGVEEHAVEYFRGLNQIP